MIDPKEPGEARADTEDSDVPPGKQRQGQNI